MLYLHQTKFGEHGNCLPTVIACILGVEISKIPEATQGEKQSDYIERLRVFLSGLGKTLKESEVLKEYHHFMNSCGRYDRKFEESLSEKHYIVFGKSQRGYKHACIFLNGVLAWDPFPDGIGLDTEEEFMSIESLA